MWLWVGCTFRAHIDCTLGAHRPRPAVDGAVYTYWCVVAQRTAYFGVRVRRVTPCDPVKNTKKAYTPFARAGQS